MIAKIHDRVFFRALRIDIQNKAKFANMYVVYPISLMQM